ncbi:acyl carrier protein [Streptomyces sp. NPDC058612]|uniref:acyl carrier protein n=1 Tax=Streptomyces sp. NPDC058612 TaxID=3346555 RepID=UPI003661F0CE
MTSTNGITEIFRRVLETEEITSESDFFALGGDSLLGTRVLSAIAREYGVELDFAQFLAAPTPSALARTVEGAAR